MQNNNMLNVTGRKMIFKNEKGFYSTSISSKKQDGTYDNMYISVGFPKGDDIPNKSIVNIKNAFLSFFRANNPEGKLENVVKLVIMDYELDNAEPIQQSEQVSEPTTQNAEIGEQGQIEAMWDEDTLPF